MGHMSMVIGWYLTNLIVPNDSLEKEMLIKMKRKKK